MEVVFFIWLRPTIRGTAQFTREQHSRFFFPEKAIGMKAQRVIFIHAAVQVRARIIVLHAPEPFLIDGGVGEPGTV